MNKKKILSLTLAGCMLTSTVQPIGPRKILLPFAKIIRNILKGSNNAWKGFRKIAPAAAKITGGLLAYHFLTRPIDNGIEKIIDKFPHPFKKIFKNPKENRNRLQDKHISSETPKVDFANQNDFAPGSIDPEIAKLRKKIRRKKLSNNPNVKQRTKIPRLILFHGETQVGKSHSAEALANELGAKKIIRLPGSRIESKWIGESSDILTDIYEEAKSASSKNHPAVIIFEEIDGAVNKKVRDVHGVAKKIAETLQFIRDEILKKDVNVYIIATTNFIEELPDAIISRFEADCGIIEVKASNKEARKHILAKEAEKQYIELTEEFLEESANKTEGYNIAKLKNIITSINDEYLETQEQDEDLHLDKSMKEVNAERAKNNNTANKVVKKAKSVLGPVAQKAKNKINPVLQPVAQPVVTLAAKVKAYVSPWLQWLPWVKKQKPLQAKIKYNGNNKQISKKKTDNKDNKDQKNKFLQNIERRLRFNQQKTHHIVKTPDKKNSFPANGGYQLGSGADNQQAPAHDWLSGKNGLKTKFEQQQQNKSKNLFEEIMVNPADEHKKKLDEKLLTDID